MFVLPEAHPGGHSSIVWGVREFVFSLANNPVVGVLCCPSPPGPAVPPGAAQYRLARGMSGFWTRQVVYVDGVELVAVQDEGFACALCLNSEEVLEEVGQVEVQVWFRKRFEVS